MNWKIIVGIIGGMIFGGTSVWFFIRKKYSLIPRKIKSKIPFNNKWEFPED